MHSDQALPRLSNQYSPFSWVAMMIIISSCLVCYRMAVEHDERCEVCVAFRANPIAKHGLYRRTVQIVRNGPIRTCKDSWTVIHFQTFSYKEMGTYGMHRMLFVLEFSVFHLIEQLVKEEEIFVTTLK